MKLSFKKRIALYNTLAVAVTTAVVFIVIYAVVYFSSYLHLDSDIKLEKEEILNTLYCKGDSIIINKMPEWEESEHKKVEVNPTFIQIVDSKDRIIFKSVNLKTNHFLFEPMIQKESFYNAQVDKQRLRLGQFPIRNDDGKIIGQLTVGISQQESFNVLQNLLFTLLIAFPVLLLVLYSVIYLAASKAIAPVHKLIRAASGISESNINTRLPLPPYQDELFQLTSTINELLYRIETSIQQQKQFTADASHEIRTPLAGIRGTLEVLLRKKREPEQYEEKIKEVIGQTDRLNLLLEQLLQLARLESGPVKNESVLLFGLLKETELKYEKQLHEKEIELQITVPENTMVVADKFLFAIMLDNLVSNAIKYSVAKNIVWITWNAKTNACMVTNQGHEILKEQVPLLFNRFYRTDESRSSHVPGSGLGLAIVKKLADLQAIEVSVSSASSKTTFSLKFPS
ncbi:ATP-binding protein [soil metagenome]